MTRENTIVVGYDGGDAAGRALDRAIEEARGSHGRLFVLAVAEMPLNPQRPQNFGTLDDSPAQLLPLEEPPALEPVLNRARERLAPAGVHADYAWSAGEPAGEIVGAARERGAALIVVGRHHHSLLGRFFGGDVATAVQREAGCPVIVVD